jgi:hypothetical protein
LLIDDLDAVGADAADTEEKAAWLTAAGARVTWLAVAPPGGAEPCVDERCERVVARERCEEAIRSAASATPWDRVLLASAVTGGGPLARLLPRNARWWPTGIEPVVDPRASLAGILRRAVGRDWTLPPLDLPAPPDAAPWLAWTAIEHGPPRRAGLPLWDGDLVLAPEGLAGGGGQRVLAAFAALADQWSGIDLVAWCHPTSEVGGRARAHGVEMRVHQVGLPPRPAEWSWWAQAAAAVLTGTSRLSVGLLLRAMASGCPLLWVAPAGQARAVASWMSEQEIASQAPADPEAIAAALARLLERGPEVEAAVAAGRALAARHDPADLAARLGVPLGVVAPIRRAAA